MRSLLTEVQGKPWLMKRALVGTTSPLFRTHSVQRLSAQAGQRQAEKCATCTPSEHDMTGQTSMQLFAYRWRRHGTWSCWKATWQCLWGGAAACTATCGGGGKPCTQGLAGVAYHLPLSAGTISQGGSTTQGLHGLGPLPAAAGAGFPVCSCPVVPADATCLACPSAASTPMLHPPRGKLSLDACPHSDSLT